MRRINRDFSRFGDEKGGFSDATPKISVFPQDQSNWRIDWFGDIAFPNRSLRRKQPSVFLHLSRLIDDRCMSEPSVLLSPQCTSPAKQQRRVWVSVGTLALVRIGDIWRNGQLALRPDYELEEFAGVQIDQASTAIVKAGLNLNDGGFLLPIGEHPWHIQCTQSVTSSPTEPKIQRSPAPEPKNPALVEKDPSSKLASKTRQIREAARFPDLEKKPIWRTMRLMAEEATAGSVGSDAPPIESMSVGEPGSVRRVRPVELSIVSKRALDKLGSIPLFLRSTVEDLKHLKGLNVELLTESQDDGWTVPISVLANDDGEVAPQLMLRCPELGLRMRKAAVFAFKRESEHLCAVVIESAPPYTRIFNTTGNDPEEVWLTLRCAAVDFAKGARSESLDSPLSELIGWAFGILE